MCAAASKPWPDTGRMCIDPSSIQGSHRDIVHVDSTVAADELDGVGVADSQRHGQKCLAGITVPGAGRRCVNKGVIVSVHDQFQFGIVSSRIMNSDGGSSAVGAPY